MPAHYNSSSPDDDQITQDFDIDYLSELLCPGQPDSPDELQVRKFIALVDYFWGQQCVS